MTPMQRTKKALKDKGLLHWVVEYWNPWAKRRVDLFNIIDLIVLDKRITGIQVCGTDVNAHKRKIMDSEKDKTMAWLNSGGKLEIYAWRQLKKKRGGKAKYWKPRIIDVYMFGEELRWIERK